MVSKLFRAILAAAVLLFGSGCGSLNAKYVAADRAKYEAIAAEYLLYVDQDKTLDEEDKQIRRNDVKMWWIRIERAEKFLKIPKKKPEPDSIWDGWEPW